MGAAQLRLVGDGEQNDLLDGVCKDPVLEVFDFWKVLMEKPRAQLGTKRRTVITAALRMGYSVDDLRLAIVGCKYDHFSQGQNDRGMKFDDVELVCRDETRIDRFIEKGDEYMKRAQAKDQREAEKKASDAERIPMPDYVRTKLDALFSKGRK